MGPDCIYITSLSVPWNALMIGIVTSIMCFLPFFLGGDRTDTRNETSMIPNHPPQFGPPHQHFQMLAESLHGNFYLSIVISAELISDLTFSRLSKTHSLMIHFLPLRKLGVILFIFDQLLLHSIPGPFAICLFGVRIQIILTSFILVLYNIGGPSWSSKSSLVILYLHSFATVFGVSSVFASNFQLKLIFSIISVVCIAATLLLFLSSSSLNLQEIIKYIRNEKELTPNKFSSLSYSCILFIFLLLTWIIMFAHNSSDWSDELVELFLSRYVVMESCILLLTILLHLHYSRIELELCQNALHTKGQFVRHISHEVRSPLNTVFLGLELLEKEMFKLPSNFRDALMDLLIDIKKSCDISLNTINEMLTYDKIEEGLMKLDKIWIYAHQYIKETVSPFLIQARQSNISIEMAISEPAKNVLQSLKIYADPHKLGQVIRNLVSNALKFSPSGAKVIIRLRVSKASDAEKSWREAFVESTPSPSIDVLDVYQLHFEVDDMGPGISLENQQKLFKEVIQFNPGKLQNGGGSGLGLWISNGITKMHNGKLSVISEGEGYGSTFMLMLPCVQVRESMAAVSEVENTSLTVVTEATKSYRGPDGTRSRRPSYSQRSFRNQTSPDTVRDAGSSSAQASKSVEGLDTELDEQMPFQPREKPSSSRSSSFNLDPNGSTHGRPSFDDINSGARSPVFPYLINCPSPSGCLFGFEQKSDEYRSEDEMYSPDSPDAISLAATRRQASHLLDADEEISDNDHIGEGGELLSKELKYPVRSPKLKRRLQFEMKSVEDGKSTLNGRYHRGQAITSRSMLSTLHTVTALHEYRNSLDSAILLHNRPLDLNAEYECDLSAFMGEPERTVSRRFAHSQSHSRVLAANEEEKSSSFMVSKRTKRLSDPQIHSGFMQFSSYTRRSFTDGDNQLNDELNLDKLTVEDTITPLSSPDIPLITARPQAQPKEVIEDPKNGLRSLRLLVVDDAGLNRKMLCRLFRDRGDICTEAEDGLKALQRYREALEKQSTLEEGMYDAILMDFQMPNMDGPTATKELRAMGYKGVIIGVTGNGMEKDILNFIAHGCDRVMVKPLNMTLFDKTIKELTTLS